MKKYKAISYLSLFLVLFFLQSCNESAPRGNGDAQFYTMDDFHSLKKIDVHMHTNQPIDTVFIIQAGTDNFRLLNLNVYAGSGLTVDEQRQIGIKQINEYPGRVYWATTFSSENINDDNWLDKTLEDLKLSFSKGAIAVKVWKNIGMVIKDKKGKFIMIDDPKFDPIFKYLADNKITLVGHLGEPKNTWLPIKEMTVKGDIDYFTQYPEYHMYLHPENPTYEDQVAARDRMLEKNPNLQFVGAHLGSLEWSVDELAKRLDKYPNMSVDMAERISHFQYQALTNWQKVYDFFIKYQDRLLYGTDLRSGAMDIVKGGIVEPDAIKKHAHEIWMRHWKFFTSDELMRVPKVDGEFKGLKLPRSVVDKIYKENAEKWIPGMKISNS